MTLNTGSVVSTGAWAMGRENRVKTLSDLCEIYSTGAVDLDRVRDDLEVSLAGIRLTIAWAVQPAIGLPFITSSDSGNGFAARTLLSVDDRLPDYLGTRFEWEIGESARDVSAEWDRLIIKVRERQDSEYADEDRDRRTVIQIDPEAEKAIVEAGASAHDSAQKNKNLSSQEASFLVRVGEQIARVAGVIAAYRVYKKEDEQHPSPVIMPQDVTAARELVQWHYEELLRQADVSRATEDAKAAQWVVGNLDRCVSDPRYQSAHDGAYRVNHWLGSAAAGPAKHVRSDPEAKARVMELLETHGYVEIVNRGAYRVNLNGKSGD